MTSVSATPAAAAQPATAAAPIIGSPGTNPVHIRLLGINDFHGQLPDSSSSVEGDAIGGAATLAAYINRARSENPDGTLLFSSGDAIGASPPESSLLDHESTMAVLAAMGVNVATPGNHEFDRGVAELTRLIAGGEKPPGPAKSRRKKRGTRTPTTGAGQAAAGATGAQKAGWPGSPFHWVSSNVVNVKTGKTLLPPYAILEAKGIKIGVVGAVTKNLANVTTREGIKGVKATDPVPAINAAVKELRAKGVRTIVVIVHEGGKPDPKTGEVTGEIVDLVKKLDKDVDVVMSAHSHEQYATKIDGRVVTQGGSYAKALSQVDLAVDPKTGDVLASSGAVIRNAEKGIAPDPLVAELVSLFSQAVAPRTKRVVSSLPGPVTKKKSASGETAMGTLIAEAQRWYAGADIAFMNPGGVRSELSKAGPVEWGTLFSVQPFANQIVTKRMTGAQILAVLEQQFPADRTKEPTILQVAGMRVWFDMTKPIGKRITKVLLDSGAPLDKARSYVVAMNSFIADGGDGFTTLKAGTKIKDHGDDLDALVAYLEKGLPVPTGPTGRINIVAGSLPADDH